MKIALMILALAIGTAASPDSTSIKSPPGVDVAGIDKSVAPGDDFFNYANGAWLKATEIPQDRSAYGTSSIMDEEAIEARALSPLKPELDSIGAVADKGALARALGATIRADVDIFNATNLHTPNVFGLWIAQDLDEPSRYAAFLVQGGL